MPCKQDFEKMSALSERYRRACAGEVQPGRTVLMLYVRGHGTSLIAADAARKCGARNALFVAEKADCGMLRQALERAGTSVVMAPAKKDAGLELCREAMYLPGPVPSDLTVYLATPAHLAGIGHWHDAWPEKKPFGFVAVFGIDKYAKTRTEKGRGLAAAVNRAGSTLLLCEKEGLDPARIESLAEEWGTLPCCPSVAPMASSACEAMCMDTD